ncbi:MAG: sigma-54-dependent transcriptional regulator [Planctomycetota bacterium]
MSKIRMFLVDDDGVFRKVLSRELEESTFEVHAFGSGEGVVEAARELDPEVVLLDLRLPGKDGLEVLKDLLQDDMDRQVVMLTGHGSVPEAVEAMRLGAYDFLTKPVPLGVVEKTLRRAIERRELVDENRRLRRAIAGSKSREEILGISKHVEQLKEMILRVAPTQTNVLIQGENGTGKELVARSLHESSKRADQPFVVVNCAAIPSNLVESELFGHERGAFTGAQKRKLGLFEAAHFGTLFLDEVAELPPEVQPSLLRALQFGEIRPVGGEKVRHVDVRLIAATNRDLFAEVTNQRFREDLYYRISTLPILIPPLRDRKEDIPLLAQKFLELTCAGIGRSLTLEPEAIEELCRCRWPGNIRELQNVVTRLCILVSGDVIGKNDVRALALPTRPQSSSLPTLRLESLEKMAVLAALERFKGEKKSAAEELGIALKTLYNKLERYGMKEQFTRTQA